MNLPSKTVYQIYKDSKGYLWLCTENGLCRWDGRKIKTYNTSHGLPSNNIFKIYEDHRNRIWISSFSDQLCYLENDSIHNIQNTPDLALVKMDFASSIVELDSILYIKKKSERRSDVYLSIENKNGTIQKSKEIFTIDLIKLILKEFKNGKIKDDLSHEFWLKDLNDNSFSEFERLVSVNKYCLVTFDKAKKTFHFYNRDLKIIKSNPTLFPYLIQHNNTQLYFSKDSLYYHYDHTIIPTAGRFKNGLLLDNEGNVYTISNEGIYQIKNFNALIYSNKNQEYQTLFVADEDIYIATTNEIYALFKNKKIHIPKFNKFGVELIIKNIIQLKPNQLIVSTNIGEFVYNTKSNEISRTDFIFKIDTLNHEYLPNKFLLKLNEDEYLASSSSYVYHISNKHNKKITVIRKGRSYAMFLSQKGILYISTLDGLISTFYNQNNLTNLAYRPIDLDAKSCFVNAIDEDVNGNIILSTNIGLKFLHHNQVFNLSDLKEIECIKTIIDHRDQTIWTATSNGLYHIRYHFDKQLKFEIIKHYLSIDGLVSNEIRAIDLKGDSLIVLCLNGYSFIHTKIPTFDQYHIPIYLDEVSKNDSITKFDGIFNHSDRNIQFAFSAPYFKRNNRLNFHYQLKGKNETDLNKEEDYINFLNLEPGRYELRVRATDKDNPKITSSWLTIRFKVRPPFWKTWWFYAFIALFFSLILFAIIRWYIRYEKNKYQKEQEIFNKISSLELKSLRAQINPHFIFNCLNSIKDYLYKKDFDATAKYLSKFAILIRKSLNMSRSNYTLIDEEIEFLDTYCMLEQMRFSMQFDYTIVNKNLPEDYEIPTLMIQPFVENSIRHGQIGNLPYRGNLEIIFELIDQDLHCTIDDNGIGYEQGLINKKNKINDAESKSLNIFEERILLYKLAYHVNIEMSIVDKSKFENSGTIVTLILKSNIKE